MPAPDLVGLLDRYHRALLGIRDTSGLLIGRAWDRLAGLDDAAAERFTTSAAQIDIAARARAGALTDAYLARTVAQLGDLRGPLGIDLAGLRNGVDVATVMHRSIVTARTLVSDGTAPLQALLAGKARATSTAETDVMLAQRTAADQWAASGRIVGYRRVLTGQSCVLCASASGQRYHTDNLMPIHNRCDCAVSPIIGETDPGRTVNQSLRATRSDAGGVQVATHMHGELGPVLTDASHHFTDELEAVG